MARRTALVVGVGEYKSLTPLPNSVRDAQAIRDVLLEVAGFDEVKLLINPDHQLLSGKIEEHFVEASADDLVLFYFSGHGITDDDGRLHFAVPGTHKHQNGALARTSAISGQIVQEAMNGSRCHHQVVILDCCHSGAFEKGYNAKNDGQIDLRLLGGEGRVVLASSSAVQSSYEGTEAGLSIYTDLLIEGIVTGTADLNHDGFISIGELHEFAKGRIQSAHPKMTPKILPSREGYLIVLSKARKVDPRRAYEAKVRAVADGTGRILPVAEEILSTNRQQLKLTDDEAKAIEQEVLAPMRARTENRAKLRKVVLDARRNHEFEASRSLVEELRKSLELSEQDLQALIDEPIQEPRTPVPSSLYWGVSLGGVALAASLSFAYLWRGADETRSSSENKVVGARGQLDPIPNLRDQVPGARNVTDAELDRVLQVDHSPTAHAIRISADNTFGEARDIARAVLSQQRFMPWIVHQNFDKNLYIVYVGGYSSAVAAEADEAAARAIVKQGAMAQSMREKCPSLTWTPGGYHECSQVLGSR